MIELVVSVGIDSYTWDCEGNSRLDTLLELHLIFKFIISIGASSLSVRQALFLEADIKGGTWREDLFRPGFIKMLSEFTCQKYFF